MGNIRTPIITEKIYNFKGLFDMDASLEDFKKFIEDYKKYDLSEKEFDVSNSGGKRSFDGYFEAEFEYNDYYKFLLTFEIIYSGKEVVAEVDSKKFKLVDGNAKLILNSYLIEDHMHKRHHGPLFDFFEKIYNKYVYDEHHHAIGKLIVDTSEIYNRFKNTLNSKIK